MQKRFIFSFIVGHLPKDLYKSCLPLGEIKSTPASVPSSLSGLSKYMNQCSGRSASVGT